ncbi:SURF6-domain-containing protein [Pseudovirgaria hyperparasitica]|uniref:SURF6-domain-containing protein n=1 Tax=Pseudovirgaria hyperparasitica TaxID=470096 RepID=A0A6A6WAX1_9PEZI|nr:SURF6-domain-containing protein [Pseudovirgaria hyperparasitica]KAF2760002.1 SURF6-domain-containing protein [Pseudovirgaria hyperparasitica]
MADDLEARLNSHARSFEGLMSLLPSEAYYGQEKSKQLKREKRAKTQATERIELEESDRKRKRQPEGEGSSDVEGFEKEKPREATKPTMKKHKKENAPKIVTEQPSATSDEGTVAEKDVKRKAKIEKQKEKAEKQKAKLLEKQQRRKEQEAKLQETVQDTGAPSKMISRAPTSVSPGIVQDSEISCNESEVLKSNKEPAADTSRDDDDDMDKIDLKDLGEDDDAAASTAPSTPRAESPASDIPSTSSSSSIVPPASDAIPQKSLKSKSKLRTIDNEARERLRARIEQLRSARKADGIDGKPAKNRQELLEARRRKQDERKAHKKEMRKQSRDKEEEQKLAAEAELARLRGSGSPLTGSDMFSPRTENNFLFGRVAFDDGKQLDPTMSSFRDSTKKKGPGDTRTILKTAEKKQAHLKGLDETQRKDLEEKDAWLNAKKKAHGEKVRDDTSLLKKTLKRQDKQKGKSEKEWTERIDGVQKGIEMRQKKREENLKKRRDGKGVKNKKIKKPSKKPKSRPGFEGSFRSKK